MGDVYDQSQQTYATSRPAIVDSNGVAVPQPTSEQLASPSGSFIEIAEGTTTQLAEAVTAARWVKIRNVGNVPVYITTTQTVTVRGATTTAFQPYGLPMGTPVNAGQEESFYTSSALYGTLRKTSGTTGSGSVYFNQSGLVSVVT